MPRGRKPKSKLRIFFQSDVPQNNTHGLYELIEYIKDKIELNEMVEIGCFAGVSTEIFLKNFKKVNCIDIWKHEGIEDKIMKEAEKLFKKNLSKYKNKKVIKKDSIEASKLFDDESLDMIYIDGSHDYNSISNDIKTWSKKVKKGGIISGHDFHNIFAVRKAVGEILGKPDMIFKDYSWCKIK